MKFSVVLQFYLVYLATTVIKLHKHTKATKQHEE